MNDIPQGTSRAKLINSLLSPTLESEPTGTVQNPADVRFGLLISASRLDDELSVATIEFSNTPRWLLALANDAYGFPKKTAFGTLWRGVDPNAVDEHGRSTFLRAVLDGECDLYYPEMLAEFNDTDVNIQDDTGRTALHWACAMDLSLMVKLCLSVPDCDVGLRDNDGLTAFDLAPNENIEHHFYCSVFEMEQRAPQDALLRVLTLSSVPAGDDKPVFPGAALFEPVENGNIRLVAALIDRCVDLTARNEHGDTALHVAAGLGDAVEIATLLVHGGADVNALGNGGATPLHCAAQRGELDVARVLLDYGALGGVEDAGGATALQLAEGNHNQRLVDMLKGGMDIDQDTGMETVPNPDTPSGSCVARNPDALMGEIPADIESKNSARRTALQQAVFDNDLDRVQVLLSRGAHIEVREHFGYTPLLRALVENRPIIFQALLDAGADVHATDEAGCTALHCVAKSGYSDAVHTLVNLGVNIEARSEDIFSIQNDTFLNRLNPGHTALLMAVTCGKCETVRALLDAGANIMTRDSDGDGAFSIALRVRDMALMKILLDAGAPCSPIERVRYMALRARSIGG